MSKFSKTNHFHVVREYRIGKVIKKQIEATVYKIRKIDHENIRFFFSAFLSQGFDQ